jgi:hypothetical protein
MAAGAASLEEEDILFTGGACVGATEVDDGIGANLSCACAPFGRRVEPICSIVDGIAISTASAVVASC